MNRITPALYLCVLLFAATAYSSILYAKTESDHVSKKVDVEYYTKKSGDGFFSKKLYARVDGEVYKIGLPEDICFSIEAQLDFDNDGIVDALIENILACGGNACGNSYFFVSYDTDGYFSISDEFGENVYETPTIEDWNGQKSVVVISNTSDSGERGKTKERYLLKHGQAIKVESFKKQSLVAIRDIKASDFHNGKENDTITIRYDLDGNGVDDYLVCTYWERWDAVLFDIILNGEKLECAPVGVSRVGTEYCLQRQKE